MARRPTATSNFGVSRRESHDASGFYERFVTPEISDSEEVDDKKDIDDIFARSATSMPEVPDNSVALVVTSPPYFAGKEYEQALGQGAIPGSYLEFLDMLRAVFRECVRTLEPGGRIAVNVANLGRKPYRSLSSDVITILQNDLKLLLRGEVIWRKARGMTGSCAWGSFQKPANPVLRDTTERVVIASKGRFDRALTAARRRKRELPWRASLTREEFMEATTDVWEIAAESAKRVGHPAPFPVELPHRLIELYTYYGDLVLDPFMGSGSTAVAAVRTGRHFVGYDTDREYVRRALERVARERASLDAPLDPQLPLNVPLPALTDLADDNPFRRAVKEGRAAKEAARELLVHAGFSAIEDDVSLPGGIEVNFRASDANGEWWYFDVSGAFTSTRPGLKRTDTLWKALGKAAVLRSNAQFRNVPLVLITTDVPARGTAGDEALRSVQPELVTDVIEMSSDADITRLYTHAKRGRKA